MTPAESALMQGLRADSAVNCTPRRTDLPADAVAAIECRPPEPLVARLGVYQFVAANADVPAEHVAAYTFLTRMAEAGVDVNAGDCGTDDPGERAWSAGDGEGSFDDPGVFNFENSALSPNRIGCFHDGDGTANVRLTCGDGRYIGVLGRGTDLSDLADWAWRYPDGYTPGAPDAPGLCVGPR